jgi:WD40 repeat protein
MYTGSADGVVAKWDISSFKTQTVSLLAHTCDHSRAIISIDTSYELDLIASASLDGTIVIRVMSTGKFVQLIQPTLHIADTQYVLNQVRFSWRGYVLAVARARAGKSKESDCLLVYSLNGELMRLREAGEVVNCIVMDGSGYNFITGGDSCKLTHYDLLSLESLDLITALNQPSQGLDPVFHTLFNTQAVITALALTKQENYQQVLIGLSTGHLLSYKHSHQAASIKLMDSLQNYIAGSTPLS